MTSGITYEKLYHYCLAIVMLLLCCFPKLIGLGVVLFLLVVLTGWKKKQLFWKSVPLSYLLVGLYFLYFIGIMVSNHENDAWGYAENKLSFLLFPLLFSFRPKFKVDLLPPLLGLAAGVALVSIFGIVNSFSLINNHGWDLNYLVSVNISPIHHPTYFAFYIITAVAGLWLMFFENKFPYSIKWLIFYTVCCGLIFLLCLSLASILYLFAILGAIGILTVKKRFGLVWTILVSILLPIVFYGFSQFVPRIKFEVNNGLSALKTFLTNPIQYVKDKPGDKTGNEVRLVMWAATILEIKEHPFGVGTGNVDEYLSKRLQELGQFELSKQDDKGHIRYNPHNQFLQTALEVGYAGLFILLIYIFGLFRLAWNNKNAFLAILVGALFFNALFESVLQRQSGIVFFSFLLSLMTMILSMNSQKSVST
jgi:O-antigen ligase